MKRVFVVVLFLVLIMVMAAPAGATKGDNITITVTAEYTYWPSFNLIGTWDSVGLIESSGELISVPKHFGAGSPNGKPFQTAHVIEVIGDNNGTITLSSQTKDFEFTAWTPCGIGQLCQHYKGVGKWVILSGTGDYANLHGQGKITAEGDAVLVWDEVGEKFRFQGQTTVTTYEDLAHFDPQ